MKSYKTSLIIISILLFQLVLAFQSSAQCVHSIYPSSASIPALGGCDYIYLTTEECEYYDAYTYDEWYYVWADYYEEIVTVYADPNHEGYRQGTLIIDNYNSESDFEVPVSQEYGCEQLPSPGVITGPGIVCRGGNAVFSISPVEGASWHTWKVDGISDNEYDTVATLLFPTYGSTVTVTAAGYNECGEGIQSSKQVTLHYAPEPGAISGTQSIPYNTAPATLLNTTSASNYLGTNHYQWQSSANGINNWTNIQSATDSIYSPGALISPTFYRRASTDNCGTAYSDDVMVSLVFPGVDYLTGSEIPDPDNRQIDTTLSVGSVKGNLTVTQLGGLSYSIPVFCPPGTNGIQPSVTLQYNSQSGNGLAGWGWNLGGLSSVSRITKPFYADGKEIHAINMISGDEYAIDGNRLILIEGNQGANGSKYYTEMETFTETTAHGTSGNGPEWFEVYNKKDGTTLEFGNSSYGKIKNSQNTVLSWFLTKYEDIHGSYITYNYNSDPQTGQIFLHSIKYTGNDNTQLQPYNEILFKYSDRTDSSKVYQAGIELPNNLLLTGIISICDGDTAVKYSLSYKYDFYSYLVSIKQSSKGSQLNSTIFGYNSSSPFESYQTSMISDDHYFYFGDYNGDGKSDVIKIPEKSNNSYTSNDSIKLYLNQDGRNFVYATGYPVLPILYDSLLYEDHLPAKYVGAAIDMQADGYDDFYTVSHVYYDSDLDENPDTWGNSFDFLHILTVPTKSFILEVKY